MKIRLANIDAPEKRQAFGEYKNGFRLCTKRLEAERFTWPKRGDAVIALTVQQLHCCSKDST